MVGAAYKKDGEGWLSRACSFKTRRNGFKMKEGGFRSDMLRVVKHSNRFPRETVDVPSSEMFKGNLDESLNNQVKQKVPLQG